MLKSTVAPKALEIENKFTLRFPRRRAGQIYSFDSAPQLRHFPHARESSSQRCNCIVFLEADRSFPSTQITFLFRLKQVVVMNIWLTTGDDEVN